MYVCSKSNIYITLCLILYLDLQPWQGCVIQALGFGLLEEESVCSEKSQKKDLVCGHLLVLTG